MIVVEKKRETAKMCVIRSKKGDKTTDRRQIGRLVKGYRVNPWDSKFREPKKCLGCKLQVISGAGLL